jgi:cell division protein FtsQ
LRQGDVFSKRGAGVLDAPEQKRGSEYNAPRRVSASPNRKLRRDRSEDFADDPYEDDDVPMRPRSTGLRLRFRGLPTTKGGRIVAACFVAVWLGMCVALVLMVRSFLLHDERFVIQTASSIEFQGNAHVTRAQMLSVFGEDIERNIFNIPLAQRRAELESLPWVAHATVMRLLPNRMRVSVIERTPVAFVREGNHIGLVDANGVLLDMPLAAKSDEHYSFPVVTGISANDPLSTRAARMKIYNRFTTELDGSGEKISEGLSEVDLSNPEDVKALIPDHSMDILVHFGDTDFLDRYRRFEAHLPEWRTVYPKLSSVDMRYERQVVLEMQAGSGVPVSNSGAAASVGSTGDAGSSAKKAVAPAAVAAVKPAAAKARPVVAKHAPIAASGAAKDKAAASAAARVVAQSEVAYDAPAKPNAPAVKGSVAKTSKASAAKTAAAKKHAAAAKHHPVAVKPSAKASQAPLYHPPQVVHP